MAHILVIEDDDSLRTAIRASMQAKGHRTSDAADGRQGVTVHRADAADLIITDIVMPEMDGLAIITTLRRENPKTRIVAISGGGLVPGKDYLQIARNMGADATIEKPFTSEELGRLVDKVLDGRINA